MVGLTDSVSMVHTVPYCTRYGSVSRSCTTGGIQCYLLNSSMSHIRMRSTHRQSPVDRRIIRNSSVCSSSLFNLFSFFAFCRLANLFGSWWLIVLLPSVGGSWCQRNMRLRFICIARSVSRNVRFTVWTVCQSDIVRQSPVRREQLSSRLSLKYKI